MKYKYLLAVFGIGFIISAILSIFPISELCGKDYVGGCDEVQSSIYAKSFGISNNYLGVAGFLILILITLSQIKNPKKHKKDMVTIGVVIAAGTSLYFIYLQIFVIKAFCKYCMIVDISCILALVVLYIYRNFD